VPASPGSTTWDIIQVSPQLSRLRELVVLAGLENELDSVTELRTIFAPSNQAFEDFEDGVGNAELLTNPDDVEALLLRHIVSGSLTSDNIFAQSCLVMRNDVRMPINDNDTIGDNEVHLAEGASNIRSANGYLHAINQVLALPLAPFC
jgi:uncharacterized surface protein with fasciclin (FAS1) repeats